MKFLSEIHEGLGISWDAIRANKMRSMLATLGIVIGILTVTLMGATIHGLDQAFMKSISALGADVFYVSRSSWWSNDSYDNWIKLQRRRPPIRLPEAEALSRQLALAAAVAPEVDDFEAVKYRTRSANLVQIIGTTEAYLETSGVTVARGRFLTAADAEGGQPVCVIGSDVATNLFRGEPPIGARIKGSDQSFEVIGVLDKQGSILGWSLDNRVIIPIREFLADIWNAPSIDQINIKAGGLAQLDEAREELRQAMRHVRHLKPDELDNFAINQQDQFVDMFHRETRTIAIIGMCVTSLALFVGGIGIMNIVLATVLERTREIGIRRSIGARRGDIVRQFLFESILISIGGGLVGIAFGYFLSWLIARAAEWNTIVTTSSIAIAFGVSVAVGVVFGIYPARKASRIDPIEALRYE